MRVRHIEQAFEGIRQLEPELKFSCLTSAYFHVRACAIFLLGAAMFVKPRCPQEIGYFIHGVVSEHSHAINAKMRRFL